MIDRELFVYDCVIMDVATQQAEEYEFRTYWSPNRVDLTEVANAAAAEAGWVAGKVIKAPVSAALRAPAEVVSIEAGK